MSRADHYIFHCKALDLTESCYNIQRSRCAYIPFYVTAWETLRNFTTEEGTYVFTGGRSRRDYSTFCTAMADLPYPGVIGVPFSQEAAFHGTSLEGCPVPSNVRVVHDDGSLNSWVQQIAGARLVVLCILPDSISASGVSTYLLAMALGKCVIITDTVATRGILEHEQTAFLVPPNDPLALRTAIHRLWEDNAYRARIASRGRVYAEEVGGEEAMFRRILVFLKQHFVCERSIGSDVGNVLCENSSHRESGQ